MKYFLLTLSFLMLFPLAADPRVGKWCESDDGGNTCLGYISYFDNGEVYAYGNIEGILYIATGHWHQQDDQSCINITYKAFDQFTEEPLLPFEENICNKVFEITDKTFAYKAEDNQTYTMYRESHTANYSMRPLTHVMRSNILRVKPIELSLNAEPEKFGLFPIPLEAAPNDVQFTLSLTPHAQKADPKWSPYTYVQIGEPDATHLRVSLHHKSHYGEKAVLMLEYYVPGQRPIRIKLADDISFGESVPIDMAWQPDGTTRVTYKDKTVEHNLPLPNWQSYFIASAAKATFQRQPNSVEH